MSRLRAILTHVPNRASWPSGTGFGGGSRRDVMERTAREGFAQADGLVLSAGSSVSTRDMTRRARCWRWWTLEARVPAGQSSVDSGQNARQYGI
jgi:hypothetical protein